MNPLSVGTEGIRSNRRYPLEPKVSAQAPGLSRPTLNQPAEFSSRRATLSLLHRLQQSSYFWGCGGCGCSGFVWPLGISFPS